MGAFKKVIKRAPYKERSQPTSRRKLGLLEKHKDYSLRAADYNRKKTQLSSLREKAANRNEDEFHHGMLTRRGPSSSSTTLLRGQKWSGLVDGDRGNRALDVDAVRLLKTQDMGYVRTVRNVAQREVDRLRQKTMLSEAMLGEKAQTKAEKRKEEEEEEDGELEFDDDDFDHESRATTKTKTRQGKPKKIVFLSDGETMDDDEQQISQSKHDAEKSGDESEDNVEVRKLQLHRLRRRLQSAESKLQALTQAEHEMEQQRVRMGKTPTKGVVTKKGKKMKVSLRKR